MQRVLHGGSTGVHWDPWGMEPGKKQIFLRKPKTDWQMMFLSYWNYKLVWNSVNYASLKNVSVSCSASENFGASSPKTRYSKAKHLVLLETTEQGNLQEYRVAVPTPVVPVWAALPEQPQSHAVPAPHRCFSWGLNPKAQRQHFNITTHHCSKAAAHLVYKIDAS